MRVGAMVLGILGGIAGLMIGLFGYALGALAAAGGSGAGAMLQIVSVAIPVASIVGGSMTKAKPLVAGALMGASAIGMVLVFDFNVFTAVPVALSGIGALGAVLAARGLPTPAPTD